MRPSWLWKERGKLLSYVDSSSTPPLVLGAKKWFLVAWDCNLHITDLVHFHVLFSVANNSRFNTILNRFIC